LRQIGLPAAADFFADQRRELLITGRQPTTLGHAIGFVVEFLGP
jgi:hypothetical protein